jgi:hypothetical protein
MGTSINYQKTMVDKMTDRFQDQPWYIKLWRYRHYLRIPYSTIIYRYRSKIAEKNWKLAYDLAVGDSQIKMNWLYTLDEVKETLESKRQTNEYDV